MQKNGVTVDHSPIAHPELAGEGVEYDWGFSKLNYRRAPLDEKKNKDKFRKLVRKCISRESITLEMRRKFARRAREYIVAYRALALQRTDDSDPLPTMSASLIEKVMKVYKTHRNIVDQEKGWLKKVVDLMKK